MSEKMTHSPAPPRAWVRRSATILEDRFGESRHEVLQHYGYQSALRREEIEPFIASQCRAGSTVKNGPQVWLAYPKAADPSRTGQEQFCLGEERTALTRYADSDQSASAVAEGDRHPLAFLYETCEEVSSLLFGPSEDARSAHMAQIVDFLLSGTPFTLPWLEITGAKRAAGWSFTVTIGTFDVTGEVLAREYTRAVHKAHGARTDGRMRRPSEQVWEIYKHSKAAKDRGATAAQAWSAWRELASSYGYTEYDSVEAYRNAAKSAQKQVGRYLQADVVPDGTEEL